MNTFRWLAAGLLCLSATACFKPDSTTCGGGQVCPPRFVCSGDGTQCIPENALCGNGKKEGDEACDDGNVADEPSGTPNACRADCTGSGSCGDGRVDSDLPNGVDGGAREVCDPNDPVRGSECEPDCQSFKVCGNHITDDTLSDGGFEVCDDGNTVGGDGCSADCRSDETCGNDIVDRFPDGGKELCDDHNQVSGDGCRADCYGLEVCGDHFKDEHLVDGGAEFCDDGNTNSGDGCRFDCQGEERCGDGLTDSILSDGGSEACDHGANNGLDGTCGPTCKLVNCGNGVKELRPDGGMEECDNGAQNDTAFVGPDGQCNGQCVRAGCGNGVWGDLQADGGREPCDDGFLANGDAGSTCGSTCQPVACGNGIHDWNEACDDGNQLSGDGCSANCLSDESCGNGTRDRYPDGGGELCDDGNRDAGDGCSEVCTDEECGDGHKDLVKVDGGVEECDDGTGVNGTVASSCGPTCLRVACGNFVVDTMWLEVCDDGNNDPVGTVLPDGGSDNCAADCRSTGNCGNTVIDVSNGEQCDDGPFGNGNSLACTAACKRNVCGDTFVLDGGEQCDDGHETNGCNTNCTFARCGDGVINATRGEQCDVQDGGVGPYETTLCDTDCTVAFCGDGLRNVTRGEQCDQGGNTGTCNSNCTPNVCGDSFLNSAAKPDGGVEACDTGGNSAFCDRDCTPRVCGDGFTNDAGGEQCDDANAFDTDSCLNTCLLNKCGDGKQNVGVEQCDDGVNNTDGGAQKCPYGYQTCNLCGPTCQTVIGSDGGVCGDSTVNGANEACDLGQGNNGATICPYSSTGTCAGCASNCQAQYSLTGPKCGDARVDALPDGGKEACDDGSLAGNDGCISCTLEPGWNCSGTAVGATTACTSICGDHLRVGLEACDDGLDAGVDCAYSASGCAICNAGCTATFAGTTHKCGDGAIDVKLDGGLEACDDGNVTSGDGCAACVVTPGWTCSGAPSACNTICGDGKKLGAEECDVGASGDTTACNNCQEMPGWNCTEDGNGLSTCVAKQCGDGFHVGTEGCDDGNTADGDGCSHSCVLEGSGWSCSDVSGRSICTSTCGDGFKVGLETCDDGNNDACGSCTGTTNFCSSSVSMVRATGYLGWARGSDLQNCDYFKLGDGSSEVSFVFLSTCTGSTTTADITTACPGASGTLRCVAFTVGGGNNTYGTIRNAIESAVGASGLAINTSDQNYGVGLTSKNYGIIGNYVITAGMTDGGVDDFSQFYSYDGMKGGSGVGCATGIGCKNNSDCQSGTCTAKFCQ